MAVAEVGSGGADEMQATAAWSGGSSYSLQGYLSLGMSRCVEFGWQLPVALASHGLWSHQGIQAWVVDGDSMDRVEDPPPEVS